MELDRIYDRKIILSIAVGMLPGTYFILTLSTIGFAFLSTLISIIAIYLLINSLSLLKKHKFKSGFLFISGLILILILATGILYTQFSVLPVGGTMAVAKNPITDECVIKTDFGLDPNFPWYYQSCNELRDCNENNSSKRICNRFRETANKLYGDSCRRRISEINNSLATGATDEFPSYCIRNGISITREFHDAENKDVLLKTTKGIKLIKFENTKNGINRSKHINETKWFEQVSSE